MWCWHTASITCELLRCLDCERRCRSSHRNVLPIFKVDSQTCTVYILDGITRSAALAQLRGYTSTPPQRAKQHRPKTNYGLGVSMDNSLIEETKNDTIPDQSSLEGQQIINTIQEDSKEKSDYQKIQSNDSCNSEHTKSLISSQGGECITIE